MPGVVQAPFPNPYRNPWRIGGYDEPNPLRKLAATNPAPNASGPAFALARSERELWVASGR